MNLTIFVEAFIDITIIHVVFFLHSAGKRKRFFLNFGFFVLAYLASPMNPWAWQSLDFHNLDPPLIEMRQTNKW